MNFLRLATLLSAFKMPNFSLKERNPHDYGSTTSGKNQGKRRGKIAAKRKTRRTIAQASKRANR